MDAAGLRDQVLDGKYRVLRVIAEGGMGVVAEALHLALEHKVALKFPLVPHGVDVRESRGRLLREARAAATLKSEHVCRIFDVCELPSGEPYLVMELLQGKDLGARLGKKMSVREAAELVRQACLGVAEAHAHGIVHRDLKPENLFVTQDHLGRPQVKVLDFGISKVPHEAKKGRTGVTTRDAMGSPLYMSPEQMLSTSDVDARADVWSLGVILYELVSGVGPFDAPSVPQVCVKVMRDAPRWLGDLRPDLPEAFVVLVHRCLEKDLARRIQSAEELAAELLPFARAERESLASMRPARDPRATGVAWSGVEAPRPPRRNRRVLPALFVGALVGLGVSIAIWSPRIGEGPAPAAAAPAWEPEAKPPTSSPPADAPSASVASANPSKPPGDETAASISRDALPTASAMASASAVAAAPAAPSRPRAKPIRDYAAPPDFTAGPMVIDTSRRDLYEPAKEPRPSDDTY